MAATLPGRKVDLFASSSDSSRHWNANELNKLRDYIAENVAGDGALVLATGSTAQRTLSDRFAEVLSAKDFGAACNGTTDDYARLQEFVTLIGSTAVTLIVPGPCLVGTNITIPSTVRVRFEGDGAFTGAGTVTYTAWTESIFASPALTGTPTAPTAAGGTSTTQLATTAFVATSFAPIASPTFTGTVAAPTLTTTTAGSSLVAEAWIAPTLLNSWVNFGAPYPTAGYYKDAAGVVHIKGLLKSGTITGAAFVLPAGYRPAELYSFAAATNGAFGILTVDSAGNVVPAVGSNVSFAIDGFSFRADQ